MQLDTSNQVAHGALAKTHLYRGEYERFRIEALPMVAKGLALNSSPPSWSRMDFFVDHYEHGRFEEALVEANGMVLRLNGLQRSVL